MGYGILAFRKHPSRVCTVYDKEYYATRYQRERKRNP